MPDDHSGSGSGGGPRGHDSGSGFRAITSHVTEKLLAGFEVLGREMRNISERQIKMESESNLQAKSITEAMNRFTTEVGQLRQELRIVDEKGRERDDKRAAEYRLEIEELKEENKTRDEKLTILKTQIAVAAVAIPVAVTLIMKVLRIG